MSLHHVQRKVQDYDRLDYIACRGPCFGCAWPACPTACAT